MVTGSWLPRGMGWPLSTVSRLCRGAWGACLGPPPGGGHGVGGAPGPGSLGTVGADGRAHRSCRGRHCAPGDTRRLPSPGGTSLQDHTGTTGSSWHQTSLGSSLGEGKQAVGVRDPDPQCPPRAWGQGRGSPTPGTFQAEVSGPAWGAETAPVLGVAGPPVAALAGLGAVDSPVS